MKRGAFISAVLLCLSVEAVSLSVLAVWVGTGLWWLVKAAAEGGAY